MWKKKKATPGRPEGDGSMEMLTRMNQEHKPLRDWAFSFLNWKPGMLILDVGCGGGGTIADMLELSDGCRIDGIDYSPDSVKCAKQYNHAELGKRVFISEGDVSQLPFASGVYDLVTAVETVYFWPELYRSLHEICRVLKTDGQVAILCEIDSPEKAAAWGDIGCVLRVYYPWQLEAVMQAAGFKSTRYRVKENGYCVVIGEK